MIKDKNSIHYLAYGSNLHPLRLTQRIPSARLIDTVKLEGYRVQFNKRGRDSSAKCNLIESNHGKDYSFTALYQIERGHKIHLDRIEGCGRGYQSVDLEIECGAKTITCFTYFAQKSHLDPTLMPYDWYKSLVVHGASYLNFPANYIETLSTIESIRDPDQDRNQAMNKLVRQIKDYPNDKLSAGQV